MSDKFNENAAINQEQPCNCVPQEDVIYSRAECRNGLYTTLANHFTGSDRYLILQSQVESMISYGNEDNSNMYEMVVKLELFNKNLKLIMGLEEHARPLFDKSHKNYLPNGRF